MEQHILVTKLMPPHLKPQHLPRKRLDDLFKRVMDYPVSLVLAEAGYGKSTAMVHHLRDQFERVAWYTVEESERDVSLFILYLIHSLRMLDGRIGERSLGLLKEAESPSSVWRPCLTLLINDLVEYAVDPTILVLDDLHVVIDMPEVRTVFDLLVRHLPTHVHVVVGTRKTLDVQVIQRLQRTVDLLLIDKNDLAFSNEEIELLFRDVYQISLSPQEVDYLQEQTEGWIIALQMVWQGIEKGAALGNLLKLQSDTVGEMFRYLADEVFSLQPHSLQEFLINTCILENMDAEICDKLADRTDSQQMLSDLERDGLFVVGTGSGQYRYHRLFRQFLLDRIRIAVTTERLLELHRLAAAFYFSKGQFEFALTHYYEAGELTNMVNILLQHGEEILLDGRLEFLRQTIDKLPVELLQTNPRILLLRGEVARVALSFAEAEHWYMFAEKIYAQTGDTVGQSHVFRKMAQVYLDTIQPNRAIEWLNQAVAVLGDEHPNERSDVYLLLAENHINSGRLHEAEKMLEQATERTPRGKWAELGIRLRFRKGDLLAAKQLALEVIEQENTVKKPGRRRIHRFHREAHLVLSVVATYLGDAELSESSALQGIDIGRVLQSPYVEMVGYFRLGHANLLLGRIHEAKQCYEHSMKIAEELSFERGKAEALMGLGIVVGLSGELELSEQYINSGVEIASNVQELWMVNLIRMSMGMVLTTWGHYERGCQWLLEAERGFVDCGDKYGETVTLLWLSILYFHTGQEDAFAHVVQSMLDNVRKYDYTFLFLKRTLFGPSDFQTLVPVLIKARDQLNIEEADKFLGLMGFRGVQQHPGFTLRIYTLGEFRVFRGVEEIGRKAWTRDKSRQLFQLLVMRRGQLVQRDEIFDLLWGDSDPEIAQRDLRVVINVLLNILEPRRKSHSDSFFISRIANAFRFNFNQAVWLDADEFERLAEIGLSVADRVTESNKSPSQDVVQKLEDASRLYGGDYLSEYPYQEWCEMERERLRNIYLRVQERLAKIYLSRKQLNEAIRCCEKMIGCDPSLEMAYQILMNCYHQLNNPMFVVSTYKRCVAQLDELFGIAPSRSTTQLYESLIKKSGDATRGTM